MPQKWRRAEVYDRNKWEISHNRRVEEQDNRDIEERGESWIVILGICY